MIENVDPDELKQLIQALVHQQFFAGDDVIVDRMKHTNQHVPGSGDVIDRFIRTLYTLFIHSDDYPTIIRAINRKFELSIDANVIQENIELAREDGQTGIDLAMFPLADTISAFREKAYDRCEDIIFDAVKDLFKDRAAYQNALRLMFQKNNEELSLFLNLIVFENMVEVLNTHSPDLARIKQRLLQKIRTAFIQRDAPKSRTVAVPRKKRRKKKKVLRDPVRPHTLDPQR